MHDVEFGCDIRHNGGGRVGGEMDKINATSFKEKTLPFFFTLFLVIGVIMLLNIFFCSRHFNFVMILLAQNYFTSSTNEIAYQR